MSATPSTTLMRDLYTRMLLTRIVDDCAWSMHKQERFDFVASSRGHEAAQVGSAVCIEVGKDFTLPYYRDLGVVLTIGMTPYEVFRTYLQTQQQETGKSRAMLHWGYNKHNTVTGPAPTATQILHAAGIAFACKLRKAPIITVAYCSDGATSEADFQEGLQFAALHQLPVIFVCEQDCAQKSINTFTATSCIDNTALPSGLTHRYIDGGDVLAVYSAMSSATQHVREGHGPVLLEMSIHRLPPPLLASFPSHATSLAQIEPPEQNDPLVRCRHYLQDHGMWDDTWAEQLYTRLQAEVENAMQDAVRDTLQ